MTAFGEVWRAGGGGYADGLGVSVVRGDRTGLSITLSTARFGPPADGAGLLGAVSPLPGMVGPPLTELPLTLDELAEIAVEVAAGGAVLSRSPAVPPPPVQPTETGATAEEPSKSVP